MALIALDVGGTKIAGGLFSKTGELSEESVLKIDGLKGPEIGTVILDIVDMLMEKTDLKNNPAEAIGVCVPGIYHTIDGTVWAPNLPEWESYPLLKEIKQHVGRNLSVNIDSDRSCYILGEIWKGSAEGCKDAIFMAVGTGIGAGIVVNGRVVHGTGSSAGAVGWMALDRPWADVYRECGCFEYHASGGGLAKVCRHYLQEDSAYQGLLRGLQENEITSETIFSSYAEGDPMGQRIIGEAVEFWGMAVANLVSIFNPEKIILGGGVFNAAASLLNEIRAEAVKWAQPIAIKQVTIEPSGLGNRAGLYGAAYLALKNIEEEQF